MRSIVVVFTIGGCLASVSCATYRVEPANSHPTTDYDREETLHAWAWGLFMAPEVLAADCGGHGINDVRFVRPWHYDLASVLTLGIWMPIEAKFRCKSPETIPGDIPTPPPTPPR